MDDVLKRLGAVESSVSELRVQVSGIAAKIPYLATHESVNEIKATIPHLATKADVLAAKADVLMVRAEVNMVRSEINMVRAEMNAMETRIIKWMIATTLSSVGLATGLAFSIAKLVH